MGTILLRVTGLGALASGTYNVTLDDFTLPPMLAPLENSAPFHLCLLYHCLNVNAHYQRCFGELFVIDGVNTQTVSTNIDSIAISNNIFGSNNITARLPVESYPMDSSQLLSQKLVMKVEKGYNSTSGAPLSLSGYTPIWFNPSIGFYVYQQVHNAILSNTSFFLMNLVNPQPSQK